MDIFEDGKYEGIAYLREISTGKEMVSVSDEKSNISTRGLELILFWLIDLMKNKGIPEEKRIEAILAIAFAAFEKAVLKESITKE